MEHMEADTVLAFDTLHTTNHIQILKILLPYLDSGMHKHIAIYIKYLELQYTLEFYNRKSNSIFYEPEAKKETDFSKLMSDMQCYCSESEKQTISHIGEMMQAMKTFQDMQDVMQMMGGFENMGGSDGSGFDISQMMQGMLSPEQMAMFEMFKNNDT